MHRRTLFQKERVGLHEFQERDCCGRRIDRPVKPRWCCPRLLSSWNWLPVRQGLIIKVAGIYRRGGYRKWRNARRLRKYKSDYWVISGRLLLFIVDLQTNFPVHQLSCEELFLKIDNVEWRWNIYTIRACVVEGPSGKSCSARRPNLAVLPTRPFELKYWARRWSWWSEREFGLNLFKCWLESWGVMHWSDRHLSSSSSCVGRFHLAENQDAG